MRRMERLFGMLAGILGLAALIVTVAQHAIIEHMGTAILSSAATADDQRAIAIPVALATLAALLLALSAAQDTRRPTARGFWTALVVVSAALCALGVYLLSANSVWVNIGGSPPDFVGADSVSAAALFAPAALMGVVAAVLAALAALLPRGHTPALA